MKISYTNIQDLYLDEAGIQRKELDQQIESLIKERYSGDLDVQVSLMRIDRDNFIIQHINILDDLTGSVIMLTGSLHLPVDD